MTLLNNKTKIGVVILASLMMAPAALANPADSDGNGTLNFEEFHAYEVSKMAKKDLDGDGAFTLEEYTYAKKANEKRTERLTKRFSKFDKDGDGLLDEAEFKKSLKRQFKFKDKDENGELDSAEYEVKMRKNKMKKSKE